MTDPVAEARALLAAATPAAAPDLLARLCDEVERLRAEAYPRIGSVWRHFKGGTYQVIRIYAGTDRPAMAWYVGEDGREWVRPVAEWREHIERDGYSGPRFVEVTGV